MSNGNSKKKQEEKHVKALRDLLSFPANKQCFDCNQRGPTYVNTTIGSFVCISCSGKLRGLTPPHRVKSISMASFTSEEIEFMKSKGNEYCNNVWMGLFSPSETIDTKDDQNFKDHLAAKYEKKRWYIEGGALPARQMQHHQEQQAQPVIRKSTASPVALERPSPAKIFGSSCDLLADLDIFAPPQGVSQRKPTLPMPKVAAAPHKQVDQPFFANFQNADFFVAGDFGSVPPPPPGNGVRSTEVAPSTVMKDTTVAAPEDRYSALKDLDTLLTSRAAEVGSTNNGVNWALPSWNSSTATPAQPIAPSGTSLFWNGEAASPAAGGRPLAPAAWPSQTSHSSNPFLSSSPMQCAQMQNGGGRPVLPWSNFSSSPASVNHQPWAALEAPAGVSNGRASGPISAVKPLTSSQSMNLSPKTWSSPSVHNPFLDACLTKGRSHNPFL